MNFKTMMNTLANDNYRLDLSLLQAVEVCNLLSVEDEPVIYTLDLSTTEKAAAFANTLPEVREAFWSDKKMTAIKALRDASKAPGTRLPEGSVHNCLGLKQTKDAIDAFWVTGPKAL